MANNEYPPIGDEAVRISHELLTTFRINGHIYNNITVTTDHPEFTDTFDPNVLTLEEALTLYWPGGKPRDDGRTFFETISLLPEESGVTAADFAHQTKTIREAILGASIGQTALDRVPGDIKQGWEDVKAQYPVPILAAHAMCELQGLPLAVCRTSSVVKSEMIPEGTKMMHLWYPNYISPKPVLGTLKKVVRKIIQEETI